MEKPKKMKMKKMKMTVETKQDRTGLQVCQSTPSSHESSQRAKVFKESFEEKASGPASSSSFMLLVWQNEPNTDFVDKCFGC